MWRSAARRRSSSSAATGRAHDELVEDGRGVGKREAFERGNPPARVSRLLRALRRHLLQTAPAHRRHVDGRGERDQTLVGADVRRGLLAADVLLARGEREHEAAPPFAVVGDADEPARYLARVLLARGEETDVGAAERERHAERLALGHDDVRVTCAGRAQEAERRALGDDDDQQRPGGVRLVGQRLQVFDAAEKVRRLDDDCRHRLV